MKETKFLKVVETFYSIQGESSWVGYPCFFIRLSGCNLRCSSCDTTYAYDGGSTISIPDLLTLANSYRLVEITGGEPLFQPNTEILVKELLTNKHVVLIKTNGSLPIHSLSLNSIIIMDVKCPSSGMADKLLVDNIYDLGYRNIYKQRNFSTNFKYIHSIWDEIKFVIENREDYDYAKNILDTYSLKCSTIPILFSPVFGKIEPLQIAQWIMEDNLNIKLQIQLHKLLWDSNKRGV